MPTYSDDTYGTPATYGGVQTYQPTATETAGTAGRYVGATGSVIQVATALPQSPVVAAILGGLQIFAGAGEVAGAVVTDVGTGGTATPVDIPVAINGVANILGGISTITGLVKGGQVQSPPPSGGIGISCGSLLCLAAESIVNAMNAGGVAYATFFANQPGGTLTAADVWQYVTPADHVRMEDVMELLLDYANDPANTDNSVIRKWFNRFFVLVGNSDSMEGMSPPVWRFDQILPSDTVLSFLTRTSPGWNWAADTVNTGMVLGTQPAPGITAYCQVTPADFDRMIWYLYTPASGLPKRSTLGDTNLLLSLLPINY